MKTSNSMWIRGAVVASIFFLLCLGIWFLWGKKLVPERLSTPVDKVNILETQGAPDFELNNLAGQKVRLSGFLGKIVILNFWATWCAPCVTEFPSMLRMAKTMGDRVVLVTVAADERKEDVLAFINTFKGTANNVVHLWDPNIAVAKAFGTEKLPETYILKKDQKLAKKLVNALEWDSSEVLAYLSSLK